MASRTRAVIFDIDGVLFTTAENPGGDWNLWENSPGNYSLWESADSYNYPIEESGTLSVAAVPELSTWAMMGLGFAGLGVAGRGRARRRPEESLGEAPNPGNGRGRNRLSQF